MLVSGRCYLKRVLAEFVLHYNEHRPRCSLDQQGSTSGQKRPPPIGNPDLARLRRADRRCGLTDEFTLAV
jgi:hypothetical protein